MHTMVVNASDQASSVVQEPLITIRRHEDKPLDLLHDWSSMKFFDMLETTIDKLVDATHIADLAAAPVASLLRQLLGETHVRFFNVRQLRDGRDPTRAAFQEVTCGRMDLGEIEIRRPAMHHEIEIVPHASHPIAEQLGLARGVIRPIAEIEVHVDRATLVRAMVR
jgi:hypothetical protein